ncbi:MAG: RNA polymerase sigma factor [Limisphaerales bacterium]
MSDAQLLREYIVKNSEAAFGEVVRRHADMVYSAALRQVGSADWAAEIVQRVFIDLARKARSLAAQVRENGSLAGWLYRATRYATLGLLREERRRQARERQIMQDFPPSESSLDWKNVAPFLDEAMSALNDKEREALLLRFFKNEDFHAVGAALGVSDDTAQKRVARSLEKLRALFARRGLTTTSAALSAAIAANAVQPAPAGLAAVWAGVSLAGATAKAGATLTLLKIMSMTKLQFGLSAIVIGSLAVTVAVQQQTQRKAREESLALHQQIASLTAENQALANRPAPARSLADDQLRELMRLRGEVGMLREKTNVVSHLRLENPGLQTNAQTERKRVVEEIGRFQALSAKTVNAAKMIGLAAHLWANDKNTGVFPTNFTVLSNELAGYSADLPPLETFEMVNVGQANDRWARGVFAREAAPRQSPLGGWERIYLLCDGSVQTAAVLDGDFDTWEQNNTDQNPPPAQ